MNVGSLFSGIGGIELGFEREGFHTEWFVEIDPYARAILAKRFKDAVIYGDITKINFREVLKVDIITGGFPCQDISKAGKQEGITGSRSSLWKEYLRAIREIRPKYAFIENVSALAQSGLNVVLADIAGIGYDAEWYTLSAAEIGAPHQRERIFIIAYPHDDGQHRGQEFERPIQNNIKWDVEKIVRERLRCQSGVIQNYEYDGTQRMEYSESWELVPLFCRVADGIPNRVDRIKCLGNAVVPQCAQVFARAIKEVEDK